MGAGWDAGVGMTLLPLFIPIPALTGGSASCDLPYMGRLFIPNPPLVVGSSSWGFLIIGRFFADLLMRSSNRDKSLSDIYNTDATCLSFNIIYVFNIYLYHLYGNNQRSISKLANKIGS